MPTCLGPVRWAAVELDPDGFAEAPALDVDGRSFAVELSSQGAPSRRIDMGVHDLGDPA